MSYMFHVKIVTKEKCDGAWYAKPRNIVNINARCFCPHYYLSLLLIISKSSFWHLRLNRFFLQYNGTIVITAMIY